MIINNKEYIPSYILEDLVKKDTIIEINFGWVVETEKSSLSISHEKFGFYSFSYNSDEYRLISHLLNKENSLYDSTVLKINTLINLWKNSVIKIKPNIASKYVPKERYIWFFEYLKKYESSQLNAEDLLRRIFDARITIIGIGGLGSSLAMLLAAHGVGNIRIVHGDILEESNLNRQLFYSFKDIGGRKTDLLKKEILSHNDLINVEDQFFYINSYEDALKSIEKSDMVFLCADQPRFKIKAWVGQACFDLKIPLVTMSGQWIGPISFSDISPCYACVARHHSFRIADLSRMIKSIQDLHMPRASFGPIPCIAAGYFASLALHYISGIDKETFLQKRFIFDLFSIGQEEYIQKYSDCPVCGKQ